MSDLAPMAPVMNGEGNTKPPRSNSAIRWCFTWNNYCDLLIPQFRESLNKLCRGWIFGYEVGSNGTPHLQGYIEFNKKSRPIESFKLPCIHWEKAKGSKEDNIKYCSKDNKYEFKSFRPLKIITNLYPWQSSVLDIIKKIPDDRTINWFYDKKGNCGKTSFTKYLMYHYKAVLLEGKKNDILYVASLNDSDIYIYDLERSMEDFVPYGAIEKIKNGCYMSSKYESTVILRNCPHVIIFANFKPDIDKLSKDRWNVLRIDYETMSFVSTNCKQPIVSDLLLALDA